MFHQITQHRASEIVPAVVAIHKESLLAWHKGHQEKLLGEELNEQEAKLMVNLQGENVHWEAVHMEVVDPS